MPAEIIPAQLVEEALEAVGEVADKKLGGKWWVKPLYWIINSCGIINTNCVLFLVSFTIANCCKGD